MKQQETAVSVLVVFIDYRLILKLISFPVVGTEIGEEGGASRQNRELMTRNHPKRSHLTLRSRLTEIICDGYTISSGVCDSPSLQQQHWQQKQLPKHAIFVVVSRCVQVCSETESYI